MATYGTILRCSRKSMGALRGCARSSASLGVVQRSLRTNMSASVPRPDRSSRSQPSFAGGPGRGVRASLKGIFPFPNRRTQKRYSTAEGGGDGTGGGKGGSGGGGGGDSGGDNGKSKNLWEAYLLALDKNPLTTKMITSGVMNAIGDVGCQVGFEGMSWSNVDWKRVGIFTFLGFGLVGPCLHTWYNTLHTVVSGSGTKAALMRIILDQGVFAPFFISLFTSSLFVCQGTPELVIPKLKQDLWNTCIANWKLWIPGNFLNFRFTPPQLQVAVANVIALGWTVYLSWASHLEVVDN